MWLASEEEAEWAVLTSGVYQGSMDLTNQHCKWCFLPVGIQPTVLTSRSVPLFGDWKALASYVLLEDGLNILHCRGSCYSYPNPNPQSHRCRPSTFNQPHMVSGSGKKVPRGREGWQKALRGKGMANDSVTNAAQAKQLQKRCRLDDWINVKGELAALKRETVLICRQNRQALESAKASLQREISGSLAAVKRREKTKPCGEGGVYSEGEARKEAEEQIRGGKVEISNGEIGEAVGEKFKFRAGRIENANGIKLILECIKRKDNGKLRRDKWTKRIDSTKGRNRGLQRNEYHAASKLSFHEETAQEQVLLTMVKIVGGDLDLRQAEVLPLRLEIAQTTLQNRALQQPRTTSCLSHAAAKSFRDFQRTQGIQASEMPLLEFIPEQLKKSIPF
nr:hypothetical protein Iba_chr12cCG18520 [Ipomoea batatas]